MLTMLILWVSLGALFGWLNIFMDDLHYGRPRTFQTDAWVGHNEQTGTPSHFIVIMWDKILCYMHASQIPGDLAVFSTTWASFPQVIHSSLHQIASKMVDNWVANRRLSQVHFLYAHLFR
jgi:hypothetical protein